MSRLILLGTGAVGSAFVARHARLMAAGMALPPIFAMANSRGLQLVTGDALATLESLRAAPRVASDWLAAHDFSAGDVLVDASSSDALAARHAAWLAAGASVVTACKLGLGTALARWQAIDAARRLPGRHYGDSATVGAGLPLIREIRRLRRGGDAIHAIAGVLSGSLAWLFNHFDGELPFSAWVRRARDAGYTEPDPREDLSGEDVRRKLLILCRSAGFELEAEAVKVTSLVPEALAGLSKAKFDAALPQIDAALAQTFRASRERGEVLKFIARFENGHARVGLESLPLAHPLAQGTGTDNRVAIWTDRYHAQPLVIQGAGAGAEVTAAALLDDVLAAVEAK
ncbi:homoserine dehydrogenase [Lysobacteraceae bacterium NML120232]|nr:homoserine dehydrogenase [Xanthomonadaceae bacterium NML08-0793]PJK11702.1 homoserine dehydrogenase [Xanthomonadaceae bacterium NML120232]